MSAPQIAYMQRRGQLYNVDPDEAGPLIYAQINSASNGELADYLAKAKAQRKAERDRMLERAKEKQVGASPAAAPCAEVRAQAACDRSCGLGRRT